MEPTKLTLERLLEIRREFGVAPGEMALPTGLLEDPIPAGDKVTAFVKVELPEYALTALSGAITEAERKALLEELVRDRIRSLLRGDETDPSAIRMSLPVDLPMPMPTDLPVTLSPSLRTALEIPEPGPPHDGLMRPLPPMEKPPIRVIPETLTPLTPLPDPMRWLEDEELTMKPDTAEKIRAIWSTVERVAEELIQAAEALYGPKTGEQKKTYVEGKLLEYLKQLEGRVDIIPGWMEPIVFKAVEFSVGFIIERVLKALKDRKAL